MLLRSSSSSLSSTSSFSSVSSSSSPHHHHRHHPHHPPHHADDDNRAIDWVQRWVTTNWTNHRSTAQVWQPHADGDWMMRTMMIMMMMRMMMLMRMMMRMIQPFIWGTNSCFFVVVCNLQSLTAHLVAVTCCEHWLFCKFYGKQTLTISEKLQNCLQALYCLTCWAILWRRFSD